VLAHARKVRPGAEVILMTGHASVESAVRAMKLGAFHYITKPLTSKRSPSSWTGPSSSAACAGKT